MFLQLADAVTQRIIAGITANGMARLRQDKEIQYKSMGTIDSAPTLFADELPWFMAVGSTNWPCGFI